MTDEEAIQEVITTIFEQLRAGRLSSQDARWRVWLAVTILATPEQADAVIALADSVLEVLRATEAVEALAADVRAASDAS